MGDLIESFFQHVTRLPRSNPALATIFTGLMAMGCLLSGIGITFSGELGIPSTHPPRSTNQPLYLTGVLLMGIGILLLAYIAFVAYDTYFFQRWIRTRLNHRSDYSYFLIRWLGPCVLLIGLIGLVLVFGLLILLLDKLIKPWKWFS